jgi:hypothetical protein
MQFQCVLAILGALIAVGCASDPPAEAPVAVVTAPTPPNTKVVAIETPTSTPKAVVAGKPVKAPTSQTPSPCKGAPQLACINIAGCEWVKQTAPTDRDGRPLIDHCRLKAATASANKMNP